MKYAHLADLHLGSWRDQKMRDLSTNAFLQAIDQCIQQKVDFILFSGDLFNTSLPSLDTLKIVTKKLKEVLDKQIPLYAIPGSHDFSPSGKTMIDVLENAGLLKNVCKGTINPETKELQLKWTIDPKTQAKITGILGRRGLLDRTYYENLARELLEQEQGYKIFLFHTTIAELLPQNLNMIDSQPLSFLPKYCNYYAGGHIHHPTQYIQSDYPLVTYTGALFPNNFQELEKYSNGSYYIINVDENNQQTIQTIPLETAKHIPIILDCTNKSPEIIVYDLLNQFQNKELDNTIITIRLHGTIKHGKVSDINFKEIFERLYTQNAYFVMKNTSKLTSEEFAEIKTSATDPDTIEAETIQEHLQQLTTFDKNTELQLIKSLLQSLNTSKHEGEHVLDFQKRVISELNKILNIEI